MKPTLKFILFAELLSVCLLLVTVGWWLATPTNGNLSLNDPSSRQLAMDSLLAEFSTAFRNKDLEQLKKFFYWEGVDEQTKEIVEESIAADLQHHLVEVSILPGDPNGMTVYELEGKRYAPNLPVTGQLKVIYQTEDGTEPNWTSYLVGDHQGQPLIAIAAPQ